eukprot:6175352-Pleurochrysis_carterae.AAC.1
MLSNPTHAFPRASLRAHAQAHAHTRTLRRCAGSDVASARHRRPSAGDAQRAGPRARLVLGQGERPQAHVRRGLCRRAARLRVVGVHAGSARSHTAHSYDHPCAIPTANVQYRSGVHEQHFVGCQRTGRGLCAEDAVAVPGSALQEDVILGRLQTVCLRPITLQRHDIITPFNAPMNSSGIFMLYRNRPEINRRARKHGHAQRDHVNNGDSDAPDPCVRRAFDVL